AGVGVYRVESEPDATVRDALAAERLDQPGAERGRVDEEGLANALEEAAHELETRRQQVLDPRGDEAPGATREVARQPLQEGAQRAGRAEPADRLVDAETHERAQCPVEEGRARRDRRVVGDLVPELEHLARRLSGRDQRRVD